MKPTILIRTVFVLYFLESSFASIINQAKFIFAFGDSYTWEGFNGGASPLAPHGSACTTAGPNWIRQLIDLVNEVPRPGINSTQLVNIAVSGTTADNRLIGGASPDFIGQTSLFLEFLTQDKLPWNKDNAIFTFAFGTNDVNNSFKKLNETSAKALYKADMDSYFTTVQRLYDAGARTFVFNNVFPFDLAQIGIALGHPLQQTLGRFIGVFNMQLMQSANAFCHSKHDVKCTIFDAHSMVTDIMHNFRQFGFATPDGLCNSYNSFGGCTVLPTVDPTCLGPVSAYVWKNNLHPSWALDSYWAHSLFGQLSAIN